MDGFSITMFLSSDVLGDDVDSSKRPQSDSTDDSFHSIPSQFLKNRPVSEPMHPVSSISQQGPSVDSYQQRIQRARQQALSSRTRSLQSSGVVRSNFDALTTSVDVGRRDVMTNTEHAAPYKPYQKVMNPSEFRKTDHITGISLDAPRKLQNAVSQVQHLGALAVAMQHQKEGAPQSLADVALLSQQKDTSETEKKLSELGIATVVTPAPSQGVHPSPTKSKWSSIAGRGKLQPSFHFDPSDIRSFLTKPVPKDAGFLQTYVRRNKKGLNSIYPEYTLYLSDGDHFLLAARKRKKNKTSNYLLSLDSEDLARKSGNFFGKLRANFMGTEFTLYDKGINPSKLGTSSSGLNKRLNKKIGRTKAQEQEEVHIDEDQLAHSILQPRQELGVITFKHSMVGKRGPRSIRVIIPRLDEDMVPLCTQDLLTMGKSEPPSEDVQMFRSKDPSWNKQVKAYVLNFHGRVTMASVKNFQLEDVNDDRTETQELFQFGRVDTDLFNLDFAHPFTPMQAFGIALASFDYKFS